MQNLKLFVCPVNYGINKNHVICGKSITTVAPNVVKAQLKFRQFIGQSYKTECRKNDRDGNLIITNIHDKEDNSYIIYMLSKVKAQDLDTFKDEEFDSSFIDTHINVKAVLLRDKIDGWSIDDIIQQARHRGNWKLTKPQARIILKNMMDGMDCNIGINWDVIDCYVEQFFKEKTCTSNS